MLVNLVRESVGLRISDGSKKLIESKSWRLSARMSIVHKNIRVCRYYNTNTYKYPGKNHSNNVMFIYEPFHQE